MIIALLLFTSATPCQTVFCVDLSDNYFDLSEKKIITTFSRLIFGFYGLYIYTSNLYLVNLISDKLTH